MASVEGSLATLELCTKLDLVSLTRRSENLIYYHRKLCLKNYLRLLVLVLFKIFLFQTLCCIYVDVGLYDISHSTDICIGVNILYTIATHIHIYVIIHRPW